jgi:hypothetical protein
VLLCKGGILTAHVCTIHRIPGAMTLSIMTLGIMTLGITTLSIMDLFATLSINETQHKRHLTQMTPSLAVSSDIALIEAFLSCYAECHCAECRYAECSGASIL